MKKTGFYDDKNAIYSTLRFYRRKQGVSQSELAARLQVMNVNIDQQAISKIEQNRRIVTDYELVCISRALRISLDDLLAEFYQKYPK